MVTKRSPRVDFHDKPRTLKPKTANQAYFMEAIDNEDTDLIVCDAITGSGKTHIAVGMACKYLLDGKVSKIIISRPLVSCGDELGALPGDIGQKCDPFMGPVKDALDFFLTPLRRKELIGEKVISLVPLQHLRGTNMHNTFVILDEAQNATYSQLKMLGTRVGHNSKLVMVGDMSQSDLGIRNTEMIQNNFFSKLRGMPYVKFVTMTAEDIIRGRLAKVIATNCP